MFLFAYIRKQPKLWKNLRIRETEIRIQNSFSKVKENGINVAK
jgi:hypothetical protein